MEMTVGLSGRGSVGGRLVGQALNQRHTDSQFDIIFCKCLSDNDLCVSNKDL